MAGTLLSNTSFDKTDANQQLGATLNSNGLLMRMAKAKGLQVAGQRGLMNSSIGSEASQRAIVDAATPLAQQNTQFAQTKAVNQQESDLTLQRDAVQQGYNKENMGLQFGYSTKLNDQQNTFTAGQNALDRTQQVTMENLQQKNRLGLLDTQGKQELQQLEKQFQNQTALNTQQNTFTSSQSALDRTQQTNLQNDAQSFTSGQNALDRTQQTNLANQQFQNQTALNTQQNTATTTRDSTLFGYDQKNKATDFANSLKTMSEQQKNDLAKLNNQNTQQTALAAQQQQYNLTNTAKQVAANTQGMYLSAIQDLTKTFGDQVASIQSSALTAAQKKTAINSLIGSQNSMLKFYQSTYQNMSTIKDDWINVDVKTLPSGTISSVK